MRIVKNILARFGIRIVQDFTRRTLKKSGDMWTARDIWIIHFGRSQLLFTRTMRFGDGRRPRIAGLRIAKYEPFFSIAKMQDYSGHTGTDNFTL